MLDIIVDSHLRIEGLSTDWLVGLSKLCSVKNEAKDRAISEHVWGAESLDDLLTLAEIKGDTLVLPRGFLTELCELLREAKIEYKIIERITESKISSDWGDPIQIVELRKEQREALKATKGCDQGRLILPPGKGKTIIGLWLANDSLSKTIILVDKKHIAQQWVDNAKKFFDLDIGFIGDQRWEEKSISVALIQTLWSKKDEIDQEWWDKWGCVILDEQHHIPAETYTDIIQRFKARKRYGLSATVGKSPAKKRISELVFGPILYQTKDVELQPQVKIIETGFDFGYHPTIKTKVKGKTKVIRNNYHKMAKALIDDPKRTRLIASKIMDDPTGCHLIVSNRLDHLENISSVVRNECDIPCYKLTGNESLDERMDIYEVADKASCAIFSTMGISGEALDIPRIDRVHLAFPMKNEETVMQIIGRGMRTHEDKDSCIIFDYRDEVEVLRNQQLHRLRKVYQKLMLEVEVED